MLLEQITQSFDLEAVVSVAFSLSDGQYRVYDASLFPHTGASFPIPSYHLNQNTFVTVGTGKKGEQMSDYSAVDNLSVHSEVERGLKTLKLPRCHYLNSMFFYL